MNLSLLKIHLLLTWKDICLLSKAVPILNNVKKDIAYFILMIINLVFFIIFYSLLYDCIYELMNRGLMFKNSTR